jgi:acyl carrier protein
MHNRPKTATTREEVEATVFSCVRRYTIFPTEVTEQSHLRKDLGIDSLTSIALCCELDRIFSPPAPASPPDLRGAETVHDLLVMACQALHRKEDVAGTT